VLGTHVLVPRFSVLALITMLAPPIGALALVFKLGSSGLARGVTQYVNRRLPEMGGELALFLGAGVLASGLVAVFATANGWVPFDEFRASSASLLLFAFLVTSAICVHPVVVVSVVAPLLVPLDPDPTLLAIVFGMGWGLGCSMSPMSGTNLVLHTRYGVSNWVIGHGNIVFVGTLYVAAIPLLYLYDYLFLMA